MAISLLFRYSDLAHYKYNNYYIIKIIELLCRKATTAILRMRLPAQLIFRELQRVSVA